VVIDGSFVRVQQVSLPELTELCELLRSCTAHVVQEIQLHIQYA